MPQFEKTDADGSSMPATTRTIPQQLRTQLIVAIAAASVVGLIGLWGARTIAAQTTKVDNAADVRHLADLGDMYHDGIRSTVRGALLATTEQESAASVADLAEMTTNIRAALLDGTVAGLNDDTAGGVAAAQTHIESYIAAAATLVNGGLTDAEKEVALSTFDEDFATLETDLAALSDTIDQAGIKAAEAAQSTKNTVLVALIVVLAAAIAGLWTMINRSSKKITDGLRSMSDRLGPAALELATVSTQVSAEAIEVTGEAERVSATTNEIGSQAHSVAAAVEELSASIHEIASQAQLASGVANDAVYVSTEATTVMHKLAASSEEIGRVVELIAGIAEETNLLALNATIEAARAGDAGKGFAVVASEVKNLAEESARATEEIREKINAIRADSQGAVQAIDKVNETISQISGIQTTIAAAVEEQSAVTSEITHSVDVVARGTGSISDLTGSVVRNSQSTAASISTAQTRAHEIEGMVTELTAMIGSKS